MPDQNESGNEGGKGTVTVEDAGRKGGHSQGKANNPGNFANNPERAREAGHHSHDRDPGRGDAKS